MQPQSSKRVVLNTFGTHGDVLPFIGVAKALQALGHRPAIATSSYYADLIRSHGLEFLPVGPHHAQIQRDLNIDAAGIMKRAFHPWTGAAFLMNKMILPYWEQSYEELNVACEGADLLVSQPMTASAYLIAHKRQLPWKSIVLQPLPLGVMSAQDPPTVSNMLSLHRLPHWMGERGYRRLWEFIKKTGRPMVRVFDDKAKLIGAYDPNKAPLYECVFSDAGTYALFPQWLMREPPPTDLPPNVSFSGFSFFDGGATSALPEELQAFLAEGEAPVVFTLGTSMVMNPGRFYQEASIACEKLGLRAVFLSGAVPIGRPLPKSQIAVGWASHAALFPRCAAVVNQGGIGTCAQALRAGVPQLIVPFAHDQPDNARRLAERGLALRLPPSKVHGRRLEQALRRLVGDPALRDNTARARGRVNQTCGTVIAAQALVA